MDTNLIYVKLIGSIAVVIVSTICAVESGRIAVYNFKKHLEITAVLRKYNVKKNKDLLDKCGVRATAVITKYVRGWIEFCAVLKFTPSSSIVPISVTHCFKYDLPSFGKTKQPAEEKYPIGSTIEIEYCPDYPEIYRTVNDFTNKY